MSGEMILGLFIIVALVGFGIWAVHDLREQRMLLREIARLRRRGKR
jgi:flagellar biogenesis protein FliO